MVEDEEEDEDDELNPAVEEELLLEELEEVGLEARELVELLSCLVFVSGEVLLSSSPSDSELLLLLLLQFSD